MFSIPKISLSRRTFGAIGRTSIRPIHKVAKIEVKRPIVEMDGDEMTRVIWHKIKDELISPYLQLPIEYFDLGLENRERTGDQVVLDAIEAIKKHNVGIKCATITPDEARLKEFQLSRMYPSPNATIRNALKGTVFRGPILIDGLPQIVTNWKKPIYIGRHAFADQYDATEVIIPTSGHLDMVFTPDNGSSVQIFPLRHHFISSPSSPSPSSPPIGIALGMYNTVESIENFSHACFKFCLDVKLPLYFACKNTVLKQYDGTFKSIFEKNYHMHYRADFEHIGIFYEYRLIDDMIAAALKGQGGFVWACKNYDGDLMSDFLAQGFGSLGLMSSILLAHDGDTVVTEAAHGTVTRHYREYLKGNETSTNPLASIFAWTRGLAHRGKLDNHLQLIQFSQRLESSCINIIKQGIMTKDLAMIFRGQAMEREHWQSTNDFFNQLREKLSQ